MPVSVNCTPMATTINPMNRVAVSRTNPPGARVPPLAMSTMATHLTAVATATATSAVTGSCNFAWATERVITPVIVPGLAANKITGVIDRSFSAPSFEGS